MSPKEVLELKLLAIAADLEMLAKDLRRTANTWKSQMQRKSRE